MIKLLAAALFVLCTSFAHAAVDVNKADSAALESVKGIGPAMSGKVLEERRKGPYKSWADLVERVPGIGPASAARLSAAGLTVDDAPYTSSGKTDARPTPAAMR